MMYLETMPWCRRTTGTQTRIFLGTTTPKNSASATKIISAPLTSSEFPVSVTPGVLNRSLLSDRKKAPCKARYTPEAGRKLDATMRTIFREARTELSQSSQHEIFTMLLAEFRANDATIRATP